jgi:uncharacterized protein
MPNPQKTIDNCVLMLQHIMEDSTIPRNIRRVADETRQLLTNDNKELGLRAAEAISKIDEISNDPNMPVHARTRIWELVSRLETIPLDWDTPLKFFPFLLLFILPLTHHNLSWFFTVFFLSIGFECKKMREDIRPFILISKYSRKADTVSIRQLP